MKLLKKKGQNVEQITNPMTKTSLLMDNKNQTNIQSLDFTFQPNRCSEQIVIILTEYLELRNTESDMIRYGYADTVF